MQINKDEATRILRSIARDSGKPTEYRIKAAELLGEVGLNEESAETLLMLARSDEISGNDRISVAERLWARGQKEKTLLAYESIARSKRVTDDESKQAQESIESILRGGEPVYAPRDLSPAPVAPVPFGPRTPEPL